MPLDIVSDHGASVPVLRVIGEIDVTSVDTLRKRIQEQFDQGATSLAFDLTQLAFIDSMGIGALFGAKRRAAERGGVLQRLLSVLAMEPMFTICSLQEFRERCAVRPPKAARKPE